MDWDNLVVVTNHKPLTKIFGDGILDKISNFQLKQCTLMWHFDITHLPGLTNTAADIALQHTATYKFFDTISSAKCDSPDSLKETPFLLLFGKTNVMS